MNQQEWKRMYGSTPLSFQHRVEDTLAKGRAQEAAGKAGGMRGVGRYGLRTALIAVLLVTLLAAAAVAAFSSQVASLFGWFYGEEKGAELLAGDLATPAQSVTVGEVTYTLDEVVYIDDGLYGLGHITPANDGVVLMAEDYNVTDAAGYGLYYGEESKAPEGAPTYAGLAAEKNAKIILAKAVAEAVGVDGGDIIELGSAGYMLMPQTDGSILFTFELSTGVAVEEGETYAIRLWLANWEVSPDGQWLRDDPNSPDTYQGEEWTVEVQPKPAKEGQIL